MSQALYFGFFVCLACDSLGNAQRFAPPAVSVLHDVCITRLDGCNRAFTYDRVFSKRSDVNKMKDVSVRKEFSGVTAMITTNHGWLDRKYGQGDELSSDKVMYDWSNYEHWAESCYLFHSLVESYAVQINRTIHKYDKGSEVMSIALPQVRPSMKRECEEREGIFGKMVYPKDMKKRKYGNSNNAILSEGFLAFARTATTSLQRALSKRTDMLPDESNSPDIVYCDELRPIAAGRGAFQLEVTCFDTVVEVDPFTPHLIESLHSIKYHSLTDHGVASRQFQDDMVSLLAKPSSDAKVDSSRSVRQVTLLTRKYGPRWTNREYVVKTIEAAVHTANTFHSEHTDNFTPFIFNDAGHAEDLGLNKRCYAIEPQVKLWADSWLVIAPHGAHETNVLFMSPNSAGLVEAFACGHQQNWFEIYASVSGVPYHAAQEKDHEERKHCSGDGLGRMYLDKARTLSSEHDSLFEIVYDRLGIPRNYTS